MPPLHGEMLRKQAHSPLRTEGGLRQPSQASGEVTNSREGGKCVWGGRGDVWREEVPGSWGKGGQRQAGKPGAQQHLSKNQEHMCVVWLACQGM